MESGQVPPWGAGGQTEMPLSRGHGCFRSVAGRSDTRPYLRRSRGQEELLVVSDRWQELAASLGCVVTDGLQGLRTGVP